MCAIAQAHGARRSRDFFHRDGVRQIPQAGAAIFGADRETQQAEIPGLAPDIAWKFIAAVDFLRTRRDALLGEAAHLIADRVDLRPKAEGELSICGIGHLCRPPLSSDQDRWIIGLSDNSATLDATKPWPN